jgi:hypothetical protein
VKGLYVKAFRGEITGFTGVDDPYEEPSDPARARHRGARARRKRAARDREARYFGLVPAAVNARASWPEGTSSDQTAGGSLVDRTGDRPDGVESFDQLPPAASCLTWTCSLPAPPRRLRASWVATTTSAVEEMRLRGALPWALPVCLAVDGRRSATGSRSPTGRQAAGVLDVEGV